MEIRDLCLVEISFLVTSYRYLAGFYKEFISKTYPDLDHNNLW